jgi:hypothetical protein
MQPPRRASLRARLMRGVGQRARMQDGMTTPSTKRSQGVLFDGKRMMEIGEYAVHPADVFLVAFVDILGFKKMILCDPSGKQTVPMLEEAIEAAFSFANVGRDIKALSYRIFSDNVCFWGGLDTGPLALSVMVSTLAEFQLALMRRGLFCRGGLALGNHHASDYVLYGPAIVQAVELERVAKYPRILISNEIMDHPDLAKMACFYYQFHKFGDDHWFVNYLWGIYFKDKKYALADIAFHRAAVLSGMVQHKDDERILEKYTWLRDYHNDAIGHLTYGTDEMRIEPCEADGQTAQQLGGGDAEDRAPHL